MTIGDDNEPRRLASTMTPGSPPPRGPHDPAPGDSISGMVDKTRRNEPVESAVREYGRQRVAAKVPGRIEPYREPPPPPEDYRALTPHVARQIRAAVEASPLGMLAFTPNGVCAGPVDDCKYRLRQTIAAESSFTAYGEPTVQERLDAMEQGRPAPAPVPHPSPAEVEATVEERLSRLVIVSHDQVTNDPRFLERIRWSTGRSIRVLGDAELPELEPTPTLACPDCDSTDIAVHGRNRPPSGDCRSCRRHFGLRRMEDDFGRSWHVVSKPEPSRGVQGRINVGSPEGANRIL